MVNSSPKINDDDDEDDIVLEWSDDDDDDVDRIEDNARNCKSTRTQAIASRFFGLLNLFILG